MAHPWHDVHVDDTGTLETIPAVIEIPKGSKNKYELDKATGLLRVDRVLYAAMHYPANYGFVPRTLEEDGDAIDVLVLGQEPVAPLCIVTARPIGGFVMRDEHGLDHKIVCVHENDPAFRDYRSLEDLPKHVVVEIVAFFESYKDLEQREVVVGDRIDADRARRIIRDALATYRKKFPAPKP
jgi:inorganic pyrophosphatase